MVNENKRQYFIDNIRVLLTILVILHHIAITYGSVGSWFYYEHSKDTITNVVLAMFVNVNQSFFMGLFFFVSAYFTPSSYDRKGFKLFIKDRLIRLGIPLVLYTVLIAPVLEWFKDVYMNGHKYSFWDYFNYSILQLKNLAPGPLWFVETLLIFSCIYALARKLFNKRIHKTFDFKPNTFSVVMFLIGLTIITFCTRLFYPTGEELFHLQLAFFPQYIALFCIGLVAYRKNWLSYIAEYSPQMWIIVTIIMIPMWPVIILAGGALKGDLSPFMGGVHWQALALMTWENILCVSISLSLIMVFYKKYNYQSNFSQWLSKNAFTVYIIHAPIIVFLAYSARMINIAHIIKFILISAIGVPICFIVSNYFIRRIPFLRKIL